MLRADVVVLNNGSVVLGRVQGGGAHSLELSLGGAGSMTVRKADLRVLLPCPPNEEPDSYLKAGIRAERVGLLAEAMACYQKSVLTEQPTAATAATYQAALRSRMSADSKARSGDAPAGSIERRRAEALRLLAEGQRLLTSAQMARNWSSAGADNAEASVRGWGESLKAQALSMLQQGSNLLAQIEREMMPAPAATAPAAGGTAAPAASSTEEPGSELWANVRGWLYILGAIVLVVVVGRLLLHPFISKR